MKKLIIVGVLMSALTLSACNSSDEVVVSSTYGEITQSQFYDQIKSLAGEALLEQVVIEQILEEKYDVEDSEIDEQIDTYKEQYGDSFDTVLAQSGLTEDTLRDNIRFNLLQQKAMYDFDVDEEEIKAYYEQGKYELHARHILVETEDEAKEVEERLANGEDFATVAKEVSTDTSSAEDGGNLDWFTVGSMTTEFNDAAYALDINEISDPVKSEYGYHIIQVLEKREVEDYASYEEQKDTIISSIKDQKVSEMDWDTVESKLVKEAKVDIKDEDLKNAFSTADSTEDTQ